MVRRPGLWKQRLAEARAAADWGLATVYATVAAVGLEVAAVGLEVAAALMSVVEAGAHY